MVYRFADGREQRELRHPDEVFDSASLETLRGVPVTIEHPDTMVSAQNWKSLAVGHTGDDVRGEGQFLCAGVLVQDAEACRRVEDKAAPDHLEELSLGYHADFDPTPGEWEGEPYDGVQRNIVYNHLALLPPGHARGGPDVRLRLDSDSAICVGMATAQPRLDNAATTINTSAAPARPVTRVRVDGIEYDAGSDSHVSALEKKISTLETERNDARTALEKEKARADAAEKAASPEAIAQRAAIRADILAKASARKVDLVALAKRLDKKDAESVPDMAIVGEILKSMGAEPTGDAAVDLLVLKALWQTQNGGAKTPEAPTDSTPVGPPPVDPNAPQGPSQDSKFVPKGGAGGAGRVDGAGAQTERAARGRAREKTLNAWKPKD